MCFELSGKSVWFNIVTRVEKANGVAGGVKFSCLTQSDSTAKSTAAPQQIYSLQRSILCVIWQHKRKLKGSRSCVKV